MRRFLIPLLLLLIPLFFFYKLVFFHLIPFPGDLLLNNYEPYKSDRISNSVSGYVYSKGQGADVVRELYPWKYFAIDSIKKGQFPFWNPYNFSGNPLFGNLQSGTLYPVNVVFFMLPFVDAWSVYILLQFLFLFVFTYLYLREIKLRVIPSLFGAVSFTFCAFITVWGEYGNVGHSIAFLPLALFSVEKIYGSKKWYWYLLFLGSLVSSIMAGYIQATIYIYILVGFYTAFRFFPSFKKNMWSMCSIYAVMLAALFISAVQMLPLYEFMTHSLRTNYPYSELLERLLPWKSVVTFIAPDFFGNPVTGNYFLKGSLLERALYIGVWPFIFAVCAVFTKKSFFKNFFLLSSFLIFITCIAIPPVASMHSIGIPFLSTGIPTRAILILSFCLSVLSAIGLQVFLEKKDKKKIILVCLIFLLIYISLWVLTFAIGSPLLLVSRHNLIVPTGIFIAGLIFVFMPVPKKYSGSLLLVLTIFDLFYGFQKFNSFVPQSYIYPETGIEQKIKIIQGIDRYWGYGAANIDANFQTYEKNYSTEGYDALYGRRYGQFIQASSNGKFLRSVPRTVANIYKGFGVNDLKQNPYRQRALDLTGVFYVLNRSGVTGIDSAFDEKKYKLIWEKNVWQIYKNKNVLPRITLFGSYQVESDPQKIVRTLYSSQFDFHKTLILELPPAGYNIEPDKKSLVKNILYAPNRISVQTVSSRDQLLFVSDNFFPGWKVQVDGKESVIMRANYTFRAVPVKSGKHTIVMYYLPSSFIIGLWVTSISILSLIVVFLSITILNKNKHAKNTKQ